MILTTQFLIAISNRADTPDANIASYRRELPKPLASALQPDYVQRTSQAEQGPCGRNPYSVHRLGQMS